MHPRTTARLAAINGAPIGYINGRPIPAICGGSDDPPPADPPPADPPPPVEPSPTDKGFPEGTPVAEMAPEQQAAYWRFHARKHEDRVKQMADYDALKTAADELAQIKAANATDQEKAVMAAREEAAAEARREALPRLVRAEFKAAAAGRLDAARIDAIVEPLDLTKFATDTGEVDEAKVAAYVDGIAPTKPHIPDLGQGRRPGKPGPSVASGREMYESRHTKANA